MIEAVSDRLQRELLHFDHSFHMPTTAILGGGLSGLSTAYYLSRALPPSHKIVLLEKSKRFGGWIHTFRHESGISFEAGPRSVRPVGLQGLLTLDLVSLLKASDLAEKSHRSINWV